MNLGDKVKDSITGYTGIVIARTEWMYGCIRIIVQSADLHEGVPVAPQTFDEPQLQLVKAGVVKNIPVDLDKPTPANHGDRPHVTRGR